MFRRLIDWYDEWKFTRDFEKKKKELIKLDPFIYDLPDNNKVDK